MAQVPCVGTARLNSRAVRDHNLALVLHALERHHGGSRSLVCGATGLTPGAVTLLVNELMDAGFLVTSDTMEAEGGRRKKQLSFSDDSYPVAVIELVPGRVRLVCEAFGGARLVDETYERDFRGADAGDFAAFAAELICGLARRLDAEGRLPLHAVGVITSAPVRSNRSEVLANLDFGWEMMDFGALITRALAEHGVSAPVVLLKDADCAAWAEVRHMEDEGGPMPAGTLFISSNDGIGGSFILGDRIYNGPLGTGMTIGHIQLNPEGELCCCGKRGCLTTYAGADALLETSGLGPYARAHGRDAAVCELRRRWQAGEEPAHGAVERAIRYVRVAIEIALTLLVADCVIVGGYLATCLDEILAVENGFSSLGVEGVTAFRPAALGSDAAVLGGLMRMRGALIDHAAELMRGEPLDAATLLQDTL
ncbi:ROK family protein [Collinsella intestinalis]|uniref:ROK family protein n=1 Tax=Collinsella intestinalis TaxID=147207 RepID=UPI001957776E|nr:ROK family protein [Collinsella intestinalis]MBM6907017.1 ROK family protein [Collinsella intestinalis]